VLRVEGAEAAEQRLGLGLGRWAPLQVGLGPRRRAQPALERRPGGLGGHGPVRATGAPQGVPGLAVCQHRLVVVGAGRRGAPGGRDRHVPLQAGHLGRQGVHHGLQRRPLLGAPALDGPAGPPAPAQDQRPGAPDQQHQDEGAAGRDTAAVLRRCLALRQALGDGDRAADRVLPQPPLLRLEGRVGRAGPGRGDADAAPAPLGQEEGDHRPGQGGVPAQSRRRGLGGLGAVGDDHDRHALAPSGQRALRGLEPVEVLGSELLRAGVDDQGAVADALGRDQPERRRRGDQAQEGDQQEGGAHRRAPGEIVGRRLPGRAARGGAPYPFRRRRADRRARCGW
jgi:hypothetical protein